MVLIDISGFLKGRKLCFFKKTNYMSMCIFSYIYVDSYYSAKWI